MCIHRWLIPTAGGPVSVGVCQLCGVAKEFSNSIYACTRVKSFNYPLPQMPDSELVWEHAHGIPREPVKRGRPKKVAMGGKE